jgi:glycosyltransferase involved in cell wall biosynthesis
MSENYSPQVDIICPSYNSARYLPEMIESVLHQDYPKAELFIQDGGSTDGTIDILRRYPIRWNREADNGISQALNRAIRATRGEIIGFTSTDDVVQPGAIAAAVDAFRRNSEVVMVYGDCYMIDPKGRVFNLWESRAFDLDKLFWGDYIPYQTVYVKRQAIYTVGAFDESLKLAQDWDMWLRFGACFPSRCFEYIPRAQGSYRIAYDSAGWSNMREAANCHDKVLSKFFDDRAKVAQLRDREKALAGGLFGLVTLHILAGQKALAWKGYFRAAQFYPRLLLTRNGIVKLVQIVGGVGLWRVHKKVQHVIGLTKFAGS